jgi:hypothetical protein
MALVSERAMVLLITILLLLLLLLVVLLLTDTANNNNNNNNNTKSNIFRVPTFPPSVTCSKQSCLPPFHVGFLFGLVFDIEVKCQMSVDFQLTTSRYNPEDTNLPYPSFKPFLNTFQKATTGWIVATKLTLRIEVPYFSLPVASDSIPKWHS